MKKLILVSLLCITFSVSLLYAQVGWLDEAIITNEGNHNYGHCCIATDYAGRLHVALRKLEGTETDCCDMDYYRSLNTGMSWNQILLGPPGGEQYVVNYRSDDITTSGDDVMIVFQQAKAESIIHFVKSTNSGDTWLPEVHINAGQYPRIAVDQGYLHTIYAKSPVVNNCEIYRKYSTNGGADWSDAQRLTDALGNSWHPAISVNAGAMHIVWADNRVAATNYEIYYNKSIDHGTSWIDSTSGHPLTTVDGVSEFPDIVAYSDSNRNEVHVVWMDNRADAPGVWYRRSPDNGASWRQPFLLLADGQHPAIAADERGLYVVCAKNNDIWYLESFDCGTNWQAPLQITNTADADSCPDIYADDLGRHVVFVRKNVGGTVGMIWYKQRDIVAPAAPQNLDVDSMAPPVCLFWDANTEPDIMDYRVRRKELPNGRWQTIGYTPDPVYVDSNVIPGRMYAYYVTARDSAYNYSPASSTIEVHVPGPARRRD